MVTTPDVGSICHCGYVRTPSNEALHAECPKIPTRSPITERIADVRLGGHQGEYLDVTRRDNGLLALRHFVPGTRPADTVILEPDEAAKLAAFILRTLTRGVRYGITEAGREALRGES